MEASVRFRLLSFPHYYFFLSGAHIEAASSSATILCKIITRVARPVKEPAPATRGTQQAYRLLSSSDHTPGLAWIHVSPGQMAVCIRVRLLISVRVGFLLLSFASGGRLRRVSTHARGGFVGGGGGGDAEPCLEPARCPT